MSITTYSLAEVAEQIGAPSERWVVEQLRAGRFPGRKLGRTWRMTEQDVADALDICRNDLHTAHVHVEPVVGLTPTSKKRVTAAWADGSPGPAARQRAGGSGPAVGLRADRPAQGHLRQREGGG